MIFYLFLVFLIFIFVYSYLNKINNEKMISKKEWENLNKNLIQNSFNTEQINIKGNLDLKALETQNDLLTVQYNNSVDLISSDSTINQETLDIISNNNDLQQENEDYQTKIQDLKKQIENYNSNPHSNYHSIKKSFYKDVKPEINLGRIKLYK